MFCALVSLANATPAMAEEPEVRLAVGEPAGFSHLTTPRHLVADVYFGGVRVGETRIVTDPDSIRFVDPARVLELVPSVTERAAVGAALASGSLPSNTQLVCGQRTPSHSCGHLDPEVVGVIFDARHFRLDLFVNPRFLTVGPVGEERYLPEPPAGVGVVNSVAGLVSGSGAGTYVNLHNRLLVGDRNKRLRADLSYSPDLDFVAERIAFELDRRDRRYSAGALWSPGSALSGRRKLLGAAIESQIDTRLDKDTAAGTPLVVFLARRARIDVIVDGRVATSRIYEAGNQQVDTSELADGSYEVVLRIDEAGLRHREERRFFTKSRRIPPAGSPAFFAFGGLLIDEPARDSLTPSRKPYFQGGVAQRIGERLAIDGTAELVGASLGGELGVSLFGPLAWLRATVVGTSAGEFGGLMQVNSAGNSPLQFNFDLRWVDWADRAAKGRPRRAAAKGVHHLTSELQRATSQAPYGQASGTLSYSIAGLRFLATGAYRKPTGSASTYTVGPSVEWDFLRAGQLRFSLQGNLALTEQGETGFLGVSVRLLGGRTSMAASLGGRSSSLPREELGSGMVAALAGSWSDPHFAGGDLALGGGLERDPQRQSAFASGELRHRKASLAADLVHSGSGGRAQTQYSLGLQTTIGVAHGKVVFDGLSTSDSMLTAEVQGAPSTDRFEILVNEQARAVVSGGDRIAISLPSYRSYGVRIRPVEGGPVSYDGSARQIGLYPGSVASLRWNAKPVRIIVGSLRSPDGQPVANATLRVEDGWAETDESGFFQIEAGDQDEIQVTTMDGRAFRTRLPPIRPGGEVANVGIVQCCGRNDAGPSLAARGETQNTKTKDAWR